MRNKLIRNAFSFLFFFLMWTERTWAFSSRDDDYLWLEFKKCVKEEDGSVSLPLQINYGRFPGERPPSKLGRVVNSASFIREKLVGGGIGIGIEKSPNDNVDSDSDSDSDKKSRLVSKEKKEISELDMLMAFYTLDEKDNRGDRIFYRTGIKRDNGSYTVYIKAFKTNRIVVLVEGKKTHSEATKYYSAKTSFVLFGHSPFEEKNGNSVASRDEIASRFEICISPEFSYWPEVGNPVKITPLFNRACLAERVISIFDEKEGLTEMRTDKSGSYTYVPPEDKELNWAGDTAFKQAVIVAEEGEGSGRYISSYTLLLHRSRFGNRKKALGAAIFGAAIAGTLLFVGIKRKRFKI